MTERRFGPDRHEPDTQTRIQRAVQDAERFVDYGDALAVAVEAAVVKHDVQQHRAEVRAGVRDGSEVADDT